jgi:hypothetical protein
LIPQKGLLCPSPDTAATRRLHIRIPATSVTRHISVDITISNKDEHFIQIIDGDASPVLKELVKKAQEGMRKGIAPELCEEGVGGTYFIRDASNRIIGVFKPQDEEPFCINNPKGFSPKSNSCDNKLQCYKEGIEVGEASLRECAAYLLDHDHFSAVPPTDLVLCQHPSFCCLEEEENNDLSSSSKKVVKVGSFQQFVQNDGDTQDLGSAFVAKFPVDEVHKIAVLDVRIFNTDRHGGNILYRETTGPQGQRSYTLIPIDHGYTLPSTLGEAFFEWQYWPQANQPMSEKTKEYIRNLDAERDVELLKRKFGSTMREEHFRTLRISTALLKKAAAADLTFLQIAHIMCRLTMGETSVLERLCAVAMESAGGQPELFMDHLSDLLDDEIQRVKTAPIAYNRRFSISDCAPLHIGASSNYDDDDD